MRTNEIMSEQQETPPKYQIKTIRGKPFSVERYYMLSEIEQQSLLPVYLDDYPDDGNGIDIDFYFDRRQRSESNSTIQTVETEDSGELYKNIQLPEFAILYLLWDLGHGTGDCIHTYAAETYAQKILKPTLQKYKSLANKVHRAKNAETASQDEESPPPNPLNIYVVIDVLVWKVDDDWPNSRNGHSVAHYLTQTILEDESINQNSISGVTVGYANHVRAAPGLEACLDAIMLGTKDRRRFGSENSQNNSHKSCVGLVCHSLQHLVEYDAETETDAVQGVYQELNHGVFLSRDNKSQSSVRPRDVGEIYGTEKKKAEIMGERRRRPYRERRYKKMTAVFQPPIGKYAKDAHKYWRVHKANLPPEPTQEELEALDQKPHSDGNNLWIYALLAMFAAYYYNQTEIHGCYQFYKKILTMAWHHSKENKGNEHDGYVEV